MQIYPSALDIGRPQNRQDQRVQLGDLLIHRIESKRLHRVPLGFVRVQGVDVRFRGCWSWFVSLGLYFLRIPLRPLHNLYWV